MAPMQFSDSLQGALAGWSPDGRWLHHVCRDKIYLRDVVSGQPLRMLNACDTVASLEWTADARLLLATVPCRGAVQVFMPEGAKEAARVEEQAGQLASAAISPDGSWVVTVNAATTRATVWPLSTYRSHRPQYFASPKRGEGCVSFSVDGKFLACLHRTDGADCVSVARKEPYSWTQVCNLTCECEDAAEVSFAPTPEQHLIVAEAAPALRCRIYSTSGQAIATVDPASDAPGTTPPAPPGAVLRLVFSKDATYCAAAARDSVILYDTVAWGVMSVFTVPTGAAELPDPICVLVEEQTKDPSGQPRPKFVAVTNRDAATTRLLPQERDRRAPSERTPISFSSGGQWMAFVNPSKASTVWVVDLTTLQYKSAVCQTAAVRDIAWQRGDASFDMELSGRSLDEHLAIVTGSHSVYFWHPRRGTCGPLPVPGAGNTVAPTQCLWRPVPDVAGDPAQRRAQLLLGDTPRQSFCACFP